MISQELFNMIIESYQGNIYYATYDRDDMKQYKNKEYRYISKEGRGFLFDFIDLDNKKIIEFDGDYWHSNAKVNPEREQYRDSLLISEGFKILRIKEQEFKQNKQETLSKCLQFLTQ